MWLTALLYIYSLAHILDGFLTFYGNTWGGISEHPNSVVVLFFIKNLGLVLGLTVVKGIAILFGVVLYKIYKEHPLTIFKLGSVGTLSYATLITNKDCLEWVVSLFGN